MKMPVFLFNCSATDFHILEFHRGTSASTLQRSKRFETLSELSIATHAHLSMVHHKAAVPKGGLTTTLPIVAKFHEAKDQVAFARFQRSPIVKSRVLGPGVASPYDLTYRKLERAGKIVELLTELCTFYLHSFRSCTAQQ